MVNAREMMYGGEAMVPLSRPFTRKEKVAIMGRFLIGTALLNALSLSLIVLLNVGGAQDGDGYILAEEAYLFSVCRDPCLLGERKMGKPSSYKAGAERV